MRVLILAPHADDEAFGCGGMIARRADEGHAVDVAVAAVSDVRTHDGALKCSADQRRAELAEACSRLGVRRHVVLLAELENRLDTLPQIELITRIEALLDETPYDQVFLPLPSHHQDHRAVHTAALSALRQQPSRRELLVAAYEYVDAAPDGFAGAGGRFYVDVTRRIERKLHGLAAYRSQLREPPHPLSLDGARKLAALRGAECGAGYAELFHVLKMRDPEPAS